MAIAGTISTTESASIGVGIGGDGEGGGAAQNVECHVTGDIAQPAWARAASWRSRSVAAADRAA